MKDSTSRLTAAPVDRAGARNGYLPIKAYALIGDMRSSALVATDGSIDWLCLPRVDSAAVCCRILDADIGGYFQVGPASDAETVRLVARAYLPGSNVLSTTLTSPAGTVRLEDAFDLAPGELAPPPASTLVRRLTAVGGDATVSLAFKPTFDFARAPAEIELVPGGAIISGPELVLSLRWPGALTVTTDGELIGRVNLTEGEVLQASLIVTPDRGQAREYLATQPDQAVIPRVAEQWQRWQATLTAPAPYADAILRSALTLKLLTFHESGAIVAAPTTSLPESIGGARNWDYRYCWLRDTVFTLKALNRIGAHGEARDFWRWVVDTCAGTDPAALQVLFTVDGDCNLAEYELTHLRGYRDSRPVRIGNGAAGQHQHDMYGELLTGFQYFFQAEKPNPLDREELATTWELLRGAADAICAEWSAPDAGIWEMRGPLQHHVYSKVICWAGLDSAISLNRAEPALFTGDVGRWTDERDAIAASVHEHGFSPSRDAYVMAYGNEALDAALLRLPMVGFAPATDHRMAATIRQIQAELAVDGLMHRYDDTAGDGLDPGEGAFAICSFWLVSCLVRLGEIAAAQRLYDHLLGFGNDVGLFAEEIDPASGAALGNFPQGFTHIGVIDAGIDLARALAGQPASSAAGGG